MADVSQLYNEAEKLKDQGKHDEAIAKCQEILQQDASYVMAHLMLAVLFGKVGKHDLAVQHGEKACELEPEDAFSFTAMSVTYQRAFAGTQNPAFIQKAEEAMARAHMLQGRG
jgi:tetratricopeptide (TPR) repeat protein